MKRVDDTPATLHSKGRVAISGAHTSRVIGYSVGRNTVFTLSQFSSISMPPHSEKLIELKVESKCLNGDHSPTWSQILFKQPSPPIDPTSSDSSFSSHVTPVSSPTVSVSPEVPQPQSVSTSGQSDDHSTTAGVDSSPMASQSPSLPPSSSSPTVTTNIYPPPTSEPASTEPVSSSDQSQSQTGLRRSTRPRRPNPRASSRSTISREDFDARQHCYKGEGRSPAAVATNNSSRRKIPRFAGLQKLPRIIKKFPPSPSRLHVGSSLKLVVIPRFATATPSSSEPHQSRLREGETPNCSGHTYNKEQLWNEVKGEQALEVLKFSFKKKMLKPKFERAVDILSRIVENKVTCTNDVSEEKFTMLSALLNNYLVN
nr:uncharacterized protein LOC109167327 [Ipomoea batatas]